MTRVEATLLRIKRADARHRPTAKENVRPDERRERVRKSIDKVLTKHAGTMAKLAR